MTGPAQADQGFDQAEWAQSYDDGLHVDEARNRAPLVSAETRAATQTEIERYRAIVANGGWTQVPNGPALRVGSEGERVVALRQRLLATGDLDPVAGLSGVFDDFVARAVRHFQIRHGLIPTGIVTAGTLKALDVPAEQRLRQLTTNIARLQASSHSAARRFVVANLPAALVETVEDGHVATRHIAGVGKADRPSPVMQTQALDINFNPFWTVPASIVRKDLIPRMQADPNYLTASHIRIFDAGGQEVSPNTIDWHSLSPSTYRYRQDPGSFNALGRVRINIANP